MGNGVIMEELPRKWTLMDKRGRVTIPPYLIEALGLDRSRTGNVPVILEAYPTLEKCDCLFIKKALR